MGYFSNGAEAEAARAREQGEQDLEVVRAALNDAVGYHYEAHPAVDRIAAYIKELEVERELALRLEADVA